MKFFKNIDSVLYLACENDNVLDYTLILFGTIIVILLIFVSLIAMLVIFKVSVYLVLSLIILPFVSRAIYAGIKGK